MTEAAHPQPGEWAMYGVPVNLDPLCWEVYRIPISADARAQQLFDETGVRPLVKFVALRIVGDSV